MGVFASWLGRLAFCNIANDLLMRHDNALFVCLRFNIASL
jgi:hypothetical protein